MRRNTKDIVSFEDALRRQPVSSDFTKGPAALPLTSTSTNTNTSISAVTVPLYSEHKIRNGEKGSSEKNSMQPRNESSFLSKVDPASIMEEDDEAVSPPFRARERKSYLIPQTHVPFKMSSYENSDFEIEEYMSDDLAVVEIDLTK